MSAADDERKEKDLKRSRAADEESEKEGSDSRSKNSRKSKWDINPSEGDAPTAPSSATAPASYGYGGGGGDGGTMKVFNVANHVAGGIIGKGGTKIKHIMETSGCRLQFENKSDMLPGSSERRLTLTGAPNQIAVAESMVMEIVNSIAEDGPVPSQSSSSYGGGGGGGATAPSAYYNSGGGDASTISVPNGAVGSIIGRGGSTIKSMISETGCGIKLQNKDEMRPGQMQREVHLTGSPDQVAAATAKIMELVHQAGGALSMPHGAGVPPPMSHYSPYGQAPPQAMGGGGGGQGADGPNTMSFPDGQIGAIIGKQGATIKRLIQESGCHIQIQNKADTQPGATERQVYLTGSPDAVSQARRLIQAVVDPYGGYGNYDDQQGQQQQQQGSYDPYAVAVAGYTQDMAAAYNPYGANAAAYGQTAVADGSAAAYGQAGPDPSYNPYGYGYPPQQQQ